MICFQRVVGGGASALMCVVLVAGLTGCGKVPSMVRDPVERVERGEKAAQTIQGEAREATGLIASARAEASDAGRAVETVARAAKDVPQAKPWTESLHRAAGNLRRKVVPKLDEALKRVEQVETAGADLLPLATAAGDLAQERDRWKKEAARQKERADSAVRKWLLLTAAGGFAGILAGGALFVWLSRKAGLTVGLASLAVFVVSIALYRWFEWFAWGGLVLILLTLAGLGYGLWRNRRAFRAVVLGGQNVKDAFAEGVSYTKDEIRRLFNLVHATAQEDAGGGVERMVDDVKSGKG